MKKIEKLEGSYDVPQLKQKLNEIIDYLNIQPQAEDCTHSFDLNNRCSKCGVRGVKDMIAELQDTPEQKEEWEEELGKLMSTWGKVLFVNKGRIGAGMQTAMYLKFYHFIKDLLSEREMFTKEELFMLKLAINDIHNKGNSAYDEIGEKIKRELDKLNNK